MYILVALGDVYLLFFSSTIMRSNATRSDKLIFELLSHIKKNKRWYLSTFEVLGGRKATCLGIFISLRSVFASAYTVMILELTSV